MALSIKTVYVDLGATRTATPADGRMAMYFGYVRVMSHEPVSPWVKRAQEKRLPAKELAR